MANKHLNPSITRLLQHTCLWIPLTLALSTTVACSDLEPIDDATMATPTPTVAQAPEAQPAAVGGEINANGLLLSLPEAWQQVPPDSSMRLFQASIPGSGGEARLAAFHFGAGGGGGVEANLNRWISQLANPTQPNRQSFEANGLAITWVEVAGTLKKSQIGSFPPEDLPGYALLGAVVEGPGGPWYLRLVGPETTVAEQGASFRSMLEAAHL